MFSECGKATCLTLVFFRARHNCCSLFPFACREKGGVLSQNPFLLHVRTTFVFFSPPPPAAAQLRQKWLDIIRMRGEQKTTAVLVLRWVERWRRTDKKWVLESRTLAKKNVIVFFTEIVLVTTIFYICAPYRNNEKMWLHMFGKRKCI